MVRKDNPFPRLARSFEHPCETRCRRMPIDAPINIPRDQEFAVDQMPADQVAPRRAQRGHRAQRRRHRQVAQWAHLRVPRPMGASRDGVRGTRPAGGMLRLRHPRVSLSARALDEDIRGILNAGTITARCGQRVGAHEMARDRRHVPCGVLLPSARRRASLRIDGVDAEGVVSAVDLLGPSATATIRLHHGRVVVVGGGNVAMDCARTSSCAPATRSGGVPAPQGRHDGAAG